MGVPDIPVGAIHRRGAGILETTMRHRPQPQRIESRPLDVQSLFGQQAANVSVERLLGVERLAQTADAAKELLVAEAELGRPHVAVQFGLEASAGLGDEATRGRRGREEKQRTAVQGRQQFRTARRWLGDQVHGSGLRARTMQRGLSTLNSSPPTPPQKRTSGKWHAISIAARACGR